MLALSLDSQIYAYACLGKIEARALEIEGVIAKLKRRCLAGGAGSLPDLVSAAAEMRWQMRQLAEHAQAFEALLGMRRGPAQQNTTPPPPQGFVGLRGTTETLGVPDLVGMLSSLAKTGTLTLQSGETMYVLEFVEGAVVHAVTNHRSPEWRLGTILVAQNKLSQEQLQESLDAVAQTNEMLGTQLVRTETVSEADLRGALETQVRKMFEHIFSLQEARFTFVDGSISNVGQRVSLNTTQLLLETARRRDEKHENEGPPATDANNLAQRADSDADAIGALFGPTRKPSI